jgi:hypothetical protein
MLARLIVFSCLCLAGCAGITVEALKPDGTASGKPQGFRYYMPKPYLLVVALPATAAPSAPLASSEATNPEADKPPPVGARHPQMAPGEPQAQAGAPAQPPVPTYHQPAPAPGRNDSAAKAKAAAQAKARAAAAGAGGANANADAGNSGEVTPTPGKTTGAPTASAASPSNASSADTSFFAATATYVARLIYLPDMTQPMAVTEHSGLLGTASVQLTLQNGWMLSSVAGSADNKVAETLQSIAGVIASMEGGGAATGKSGGAGKGANTGAGGAPQLLTPAETNILAPGLYAFDYGSDGALARFCSVALFGSNPTPNSMVPACRQTTTTAAQQALTYLSSMGR